MTLLLVFLIEMVMPVTPAKFALQNLELNELEVN